MNKASFIGGIILGMVAGTAVGILFAPDKGSETRKKIVDKGGELAGNLKGKIGGLIDNTLGRNDGRKEEKRNAAYSE